MSMAGGKDVASNFVFSILGQQSVGNGVEKYQISLTADQ